MPSGQHWVRKMTRLNHNRVAHPSYSADMAIANFYLFRVLKQKLQAIDANDDEELKSEILTIFQGIPSYELKQSFDHWIERCQWVATNAGNNCPSWPEKRNMRSLHFPFLPCETPIMHPIVYDRMWNPCFFSGKRRTSFRLFERIPTICWEEQSVICMQKLPSRFYMNSAGQCRFKVANNKVQRDFRQCFQDRRDFSRCKFRLTRFLDDRWRMGHQRFARVETIIC
jgi:hypothetical protein